MKKIAYTRPEDGGVSVITPAQNIYTNGTDFLWFKNPAEVPSDFHEATIEEIASKDVPQGCAFHILDESELPVDSEDRHAWTIESGKVKVDAVKVQIKQDALDLQEQEKNAILQKLGITAEESQKVGLTI